MSLGKIETRSGNTPAGRSVFASGFSRLLSSLMKYWHDIWVSRCVVKKDSYRIVAQVLSDDVWFAIFVQIHYPTTSAVRT